MTNETKSKRRLSIDVLTAIIIFCGFILLYPPLFVVFIQIAFVLALGLALLAVSWAGLRVIFAGLNEYLTGMKDKS